MTTTQLDIFDLIRTYSDALERAIHASSETDVNHWTTRAARAYSRIATVIQHLQAVESAARDVVAYRQQHMNACYNDYRLGCLLDLLDKVYAPAAEDEDTQPVDVGAVLKALEY